MDNVKIFYADETSTIMVDEKEASKWKDLIEELEIEGQKELYSQQKSPIPYMYMKKSIERLFEVLCPEKAVYTAYNKEPIPVRVLETIAYCKEHELFERMEVWYDDTDPDPILVGERTKPSQNSADHYLIARWGDEDRSFEELREVAKKRLIAKKTTYIKNEISEKQRKLKDIDVIADQYLDGEWVYF